MHEATSDDLRLLGSRACPEWCVTSHGLVDGEDDWVHTGEPLHLTDGVAAQACQSTDPATGATDGPYVVIGWNQYTPAEAECLGAALIAMAGSVSRRPRAARRRSPGP